MSHNFGMSHYILITLSFCLGAVILWGAGKRGRGVLFYLFWAIGIVSIAGSLYLYESITLFDQDLQSFPYYQMILLFGFGFLIFSRIITIFSEKSSLYAELYEERQQRAISEITQLAASSGSLIELLNFSLDRIVTMLNLSGGATHIFHPARQNLVLSSFIGLSARMARRLETLNLDETAIGRTAKNKRLLIIRNLRLSRDFEVFGGKADRFTHMAFIPIISNGEHWGVVTLFGKGNYIPGKLKVDLLEQFGEQLGSALVLGRRMRAVATSLKNTKALMSSLGDELYVTSKLKGSGEGVIRAITWTLTRILEGDRFDLVINSGLEWKIKMSSEPEVVGSILHFNENLDIDISTAPSGLISLDQLPPFKEFVERRSYAFCALPDNNGVLFVRMEGRRKPNVDFEFFYNTCKIIHGLSIRLKKHTIQDNRLRQTSMIDSETPLVSQESIESSRTVEKIIGELETLIAEYSKTNGNSDIKSLIRWLEIIKKSAYDDTEKSISLSDYPDEKKTADKIKKPAWKPEGLELIVNDALNSLKKSNRNMPAIDFSSQKDLLDTGVPTEKMSRLIRGFLTLALDKAGKNNKLKLTVRNRNKSIILKLEGAKLPPPPNANTRPAWLRGSNISLEYGRGQKSGGKLVDRWKLVIPSKNASKKAPKKKTPKVFKAIRVLAVDSQDVIRELLTGMLTGMGYDPVVVADSTGAIKEFEKAIVNGNSYKIVIADNLLDNISGLELAAKFKAIDPEINYILISGWGQEPKQSEIIKNGIDKVLKKPFRIEQLSKAIADLTGERA